MFSYPNSGISGYKEIFVINNDGTQRKKLAYIDIRGSNDDEYRRTDFSIAPNGKFIIVRDLVVQNDENYLKIIDLTGFAYKELFNASSIIDFGWSPNGNKIYYVEKLTSTDKSLREWEKYTYNKYVMNPDGTNKFKLGTYKRSLFSEPLIWSTKNKIAYFVENGNNDERYIINTDGTNKIKIPEENPNTVEEMAWSDDGTKLMFYDRDKIMLINEDGTDLRQILSSSNGINEFEPKWLKKVLK